MRRFPTIAFVLAVCLAAAAPPACCADAPAATWQLGLRSTGYVFQTENLAGDSSEHYQGFHVLSGSARGLGGGRFSLRASGRLANDLHLRPSEFQTSRLYNGYVEAKLGDSAQVRAGRQAILGGSDYLVLDGAQATWSPGRANDLAAWFGARAPLDRAAELGDFGDDSAVGARWARRWTPRLRTAASLAMEERGGHAARRPLALEATALPHRSLRALGRLIYDLENEYWSRLQVQAAWRPAQSSWSATAQFVDRRPWIEPGSYFSRFADVERVRILRGALRHERANGFGAEAEGFLSSVDDRSASRLGLALLVPGGRVGWSVRMGDMGEDDRFYGEFGRRLRPWLQAEAAATFQTYALLSDAPSELERDLTTFSARLRADLRPGLRVLAEVQSLDNPLYSKDVRFLCGIDLFRSGGAIDTGLGQGGWLQ